MLKIDIIFIFYNLRCTNFSNQVLRSYFRIAVRRLLTNKVFSLINIVGLSVGITAFILIIEYVSFEMSYDQFHINKDEIYRVAYQQYENGEAKNASARNFIGIPSMVSQHFPEVKACTGFDRTDEQAYFLFSYNGKRYYEPGSFYQTDADFFKVFPSLLIKGDPASALKDPHNLVLSQKMAKAIFGHTDPMGKRIENNSPSYSDVDDFIVSGILRDVPENSHFHLDFIASNSHQDEIATANYWSGPKFYTYLTLLPGTDPGLITDRLNGLIKQLEKENPGTAGARVFLQPITDIHVRSNLLDELESNESEMLIYVLSAIGIAVLILAWINYVNIEIARFILRAREVGVRRIIGSAPMDLALQFLVEYLSTTVMAMGLAVLFAYLFQPQFTFLTGVPISNFQWRMPGIWITALTLFLSGSVIAGTYPAFFLLKIKPVAALKRIPDTSGNGTFMRKSLIVIQFTCSISLMAFLMVVYKQLAHMQLSNKKIDIDRVISMRNPTVYSNEDSVNYVEYKDFENRLVQNHAIKGITSSSAIPGMEVDESFTNRIKRDLTDVDDPTRYKVLFVDYDFIPFYGVNLKAGRNYSVKSGDDQNWNTVILNESAIHALGFASAAEAKDQEINFHLWGDGFKKYKIIGITEDYHHESIKKAVHPTILSLNHSQFQQVFYSVKLNAGSDPRAALAHIEKCWKEVFPDKPFEYFFQGDYYNRQYKSELHFARIFGLFASVAAFIAFIGILGVTLFETNARSKEVSIRKVLGASVANLIALLSRSYFKLICVAALICVPLVYYAAAEWLNDYPSRIVLNGWFVVLPVTATVTLVVVASGFQTVKTALSNPVDHLKYE